MNGLFMHNNIPPYHSINITPTPDIIITTIKKQDHLFNLFKQTLATLQESIHSETKLSLVKKGEIDNKTEASKQKITDLFESIYPETENIETAKILELESHMRSLLENDFPEKEKCREIYLQNVLPLVQQGKQSIIQRPLHFSAQAAAAKGKAVQAGLQALKNLTENKLVIRESGISAQKVFLLPEERVVFKSGSERAKEEERLVNDLFDLMSKQAVVGTFNIQQAKADRFGIEVSEEIQARGFTPENLSTSTNLRSFIMDKLSLHDRLVLMQQGKTPSEVNKELVNYEQMKKQQWFIQLPGEDWKPISLSDLQKFNLTNQLVSNAQIGTSSDTALSLYDHLLNETPFARALNYLPTLHASPKTLYVSPELSHPDDKNAYETCEKYKWSYQNEGGIKQEVDFKTLQTLYMQNKKMDNIQAVSSAKLPPPTIHLNFSLLHKALNVKWKAVSSELRQVDAIGDITRLRDIQAKPFISNMILMHKLTPLERNTLLEKLTLESEFNAILTGEVQMFDLHGNNLGIAPVSNDEYERYKDIQFSVSTFGEMNLQLLTIGYLTGHIQPDSYIEFEEEGIIVQRPLKDLPELQKALDVRWQLVLFDTDLSLSEDNRLLTQTRGSYLQHLIPLRSVLLETDWKDQPLSDETVQHLMDSTERDLRVANWIKKTDAPIYKHLSPSIMNTLEQRLAPLISRYSLSEPRKNHEDVTVKTLQERFVKELSGMYQPSHLIIWQTLEEDLSSVPVRPDDNWEKIAKRYHQDINELQKLNPEGLKPGQKVKIKYDLTSPSQEAIRKREKIAAQLFPRITHGQQTALLERQQRRRDYLSNYQTLSQSSLTGEELISQIEDFLQKPETPMTSTRKKYLLDQMSVYHELMLSHADGLSNFKQAIQIECKPTYFNLMKAMYPLLADAYALNQAVYGNDAGMNIGLYDVPLEETINLAKNNFPPPSEFLLLAEHLEEEINTIADSNFVRHLDL